MATGDGPRKFRCDCAAGFDNAASLGQHIQQTGHMKARWCETCSRLFTKRENLEMHEKTAAKHNNSQIPSTKPNTPSSESRIVNPGTFSSSSKRTVPAATPNTASGKGEARAKAPKAPKAPKGPKVFESRKGKEKTGERVPKSVSKGVPKRASESVKNSSSANLTSVRPAVATLPDTTTKYPWASVPESLELLTSLGRRCHDSECMRKQGYHVGNFTFIPTPAKVNGVVRRQAIAVDCEMVGIAGGKDELAFLCAVDLFTGEVLIQSFVLPIEAVTDWRSRYSGITLAKMRTAKASGKALDGWPAARARLFEFADANTILVGHSLNNDLRVLHVSHTRVIDSCILVAEAVFGKGNGLQRRWGLKTLSRELLGVAIQSSKKGHDCLEDTLASRELVLWCLRQPEQLQAWAQKALAQHKMEKQKRLERQAKAREKEKEKQRQRDASSAAAPDSIWSDGLSILSDPLLFPPGYDPWSD
ncbi:ribonuclease H-like domain-containing protein [Hypoxylon sp. FL1284]|nr:ribonuclease H-like domain-containing protein [Hypoxylon sp. FL1284]